MPHVLHVKERDLSAQSARCSDDESMPPIAPVNENHENNNRRKTRWEKHDITREARTVGPRHHERADSGEAIRHIPSRLPLFGMML